MGNVKRKRRADCEDSFPGSICKLALLAGLDRANCELRPLEERGSLEYDAALRELLAGVQRGGADSRAFLCLEVLSQPCRRASKAPREPGSSVFSDEEWAELARRLPLSDAELLVAKGVFKEWTKERIARKAGMSAATVHSHLDRLYKTIGVHSRAGLVVRVVEEFLRTPH